MEPIQGPRSRVDTASGTDATDPVDQVFVPARASGHRPLPLVTSAGDSDGLGPIRGGDRKEGCVEPRIEGYRVIAQLGEGGMGTVWRAVQLRTGRQVALKLMSANAFRSTRSRLRFEREVELTASLEHPNIARLYDSGIHYGTHFYAMQLIEGLPLDDYVHQNRLSLRQMLELLRCICQAVEHAHRRGIIHRDLKPSNILISADGAPHVLDFGLAKGTLEGDVSGRGDVSIEGEVAGTPAFMSPEQADGRFRDLDTRTDVYSLGVILYRLATDRMPHDLSGGRVAVLRRIVQIDPADPGGKNGVDRELRTVLLKALARNPEERYPTAGALAQDLGNYLNGEALNARPQGTLYILTKRLAKHRVAAVATLIVAALLATLAVSGELRTRRERDRARIAEIDAREKARIALLAEERARGQAAIALEQKTLAQVNAAEGLVLQADALCAAHRWIEADELYRRAQKDLTSLGASPASAELGLWDLDRQAAPPIVSWRGPGNKLDGMMFFADGRRLLSVDMDQRYQVREVMTGRLLRSGRFPHPPASLLALPDGKRMVLVDRATGTINLWDLDADAPADELLPAGSKPQSLVGRLTQAIGKGNPAVKGSFHIPVGPASALSLSRDGRLLAGGWPDGSITVWDVSSRRVLNVFEAHRAAVMSLSFAPDGRLASAAYDNAVKVWNCRPGQMTGPAEPIVSPQPGLARA